MTLDRISKEYFDWMSDIVCGDTTSEQIRFDKLLIHLHQTPFKYLIPKDRNRADDGIDLRYRFAITQGYEEFVDEILDILDGPCTVFEMLTALAIRCEENIMDDPEIGDRTGQWFWGMVTNMGLGGMYDYNYDERYIDDVLERFMNRQYEPDGRGGLFRIRHCEEDLRDLEIWIQLCWFLDSIT